MSWTGVSQLVAIDPGCLVSAVVFWDGERIEDAWIQENGIVLSTLRRLAESDPGIRTYIEDMSFQGKMAGKEVLDTAKWIGRFQEASRGELIPWRKVRAHHTGLSTAKDTQVVAVLKEKYGLPYTTEVYTPFGKKGQPLTPKKRQIPGVTAPLKADLWQAFALATFITEGGRT